MIGGSEAFRIAHGLIDKLATFDAPVLIEGETGTGKELAARAIHYGGLRCNGPFVPVNCGALPEQLIENELFGHRRGAFTGASEDSPGLIALARGGTLFLDEIDTLTSRRQITLLRFLQDQQFRPLGARQHQQADVRIIAATNSDLEKEVARGAFRLDLLHRLKVLHLYLPPLRERQSDIALLAQHFVRAASARFGKQEIPIDGPTLAWFERYHWPGNIRELENVVYRGFLLAEGASVSIPAPPCIAGVDMHRGEAPLNYRRAKDQAIADFESRFLTDLIREANGNVSAAARMCGAERRYLGRLLKKHGITTTAP